ncbi:MAG: ImmA/IrrE family metallo-endopeptidase [Pseudolabrys sp.]|nr:ImmA/IrrE family metallo-endopeptidase [Pseudolabrys sp.]MCW5696143.1 ImmA/IrrE family metallo-endopeptidase [Bauldia sp.]
MGLRRGFKAEANWYAREVRRELGLMAHAPINPWQLAEHLGFPVLPLSEYASTIPDAVRYLRSAAGQNDFSAITLFAGQERWIIYNDGHDPKRQAADISHELAHGLLLHPPKAPFDKHGSRHYDADREAEANWLGPALLISDEAAIHIAERGLSLQVASNRYGASQPLVRMRLNVSGASRRVARRRLVA